MCIGRKKPDIDPTGACVKCGPCGEDGCPGHAGTGGRETLTADHEHISLASLVGRMRPARTCIGCALKYGGICRAVGGCGSQCVQPHGSRLISTCGSEQSWFECQQRQCVPGAVRCRCSRPQVLSGVGQEAAGHIYAQHCGAG